MLTLAGACGLLWLMREHVRLQLHDETTVAQHERVERVFVVVADEAREVRACVGVAHSHLYRERPLVVHRDRVRACSRKRTRRTSSS